MTLNGAIMQLVEMRENSMMPEVFKPYFDKVIETISECEEPSIIPERKKGKWQWLSSTYDRIPCEMRYMCSECHHETILHTNETSRPWEKFCPNCGADMRGNTKRKGEPIDGNNESYNCKNWIP